MKSYRILAVTGCAFLFGACAHTYRAPSNAKLEASTGRLSNAVTKATTSAEKATASAEKASGHIDEAQKASEQEAVTSKALDAQVDELIALLPPELKEKGDALKKAVAEDHAEVGEIVINVYAAKQDHAQLAQDQAQLTKDLAEAKDADRQVKTDKAEYYRGADKLAGTATKQSKELAWYRRHWWGSWIALGIGVIACIIFAIVKWGAKWTAKAGVAAAKIGI